MYMHMYMYIKYVEYFLNKIFYIKCIYTYYTYTHTTYTFEASLRKTALSCYRLEAVK